MVLLTEKYNLRDASCCNVDVVNGAAGDFFAGFLVKSATLKFAVAFFSKKFPNGPKWHEIGET